MNCFWLVFGICPCGLGLCSTEVINARLRRGNGGLSVAIRVVWYLSKIT
jgi:hypothetical protein